MGKTPLHTISPLVDAALGNINPGQSQSFFYYDIIPSNDFQEG